ncbi:hypothetical protein K466DRAFT_566416 [Polyporus arcularius HHB13444]|uniref:BTB domain-containing protein n=1 Tax=Polyporus arcularius HHB13444 TaxID=1314778 RepID=A0A5C3P7V6_9APHY|nr:hypothetical protein K466DRAFT_566416 [Polyporus arcularius HHB13444]
MSEEYAGKMAAAPFDRSDADFIMRTSDGVEFRVHRLILSMASSVFEGMFSIPKPSALLSNPNIPDISIPEDSETIDLYLRICYPLIDPEVPTLLLLRKVVTTGFKYDAPMVVHAMKRELRQPRFMDKDPLHVFVIACLWEWEEEAKVAAENVALAGTMVGLFPELLDEISAGAYYRLQKLGRTRRHVILRTTDSVDFFVHRTIITFASPTFFDTLVQERTMSEERNQAIEHRAVHLVSEDSGVLDVLLRMCYPAEHPHIASAEVYLDVAFAAHRYQFRKVEQTLLKSWSEYSKGAPLRFYFAAVQCGWQAEAKACALQLVTTLSPGDMDNAYVPEMEAASSVPYRHLISYAQACRKAATADFQLSDLPGRRCPVPSNCHLRYPTTVSTSTPPFWLSHHLNAVKIDLATKSSTNILTSHIILATILLTTMFDGTSCSETMMSPIESPACSALAQAPTTVASPSPPRCTRDSKVEWIIDFLQKYAAAVDKAVSELYYQVELEMMCVVDCLPSATLIIGQLTIFQRSTVSILE